MPYTPKSNSGAALLLGLCLLAGLVVLTVLGTKTALQIKGMERTVTVKGLSEREVKADKVIWPIQFKLPGNELPALYEAIEVKNTLVTDFLKGQGFTDKDISISAPQVVDRQAQSYARPGQTLQYRYSGSSTVTLVSSEVDKVRVAQSRLIELGRQGLALEGNSYQNRPKFLYTSLNDIKPEMVEDATRNARFVGEKFAADSKSTLGKIKRARQGQFSIRDRDSSTPYIKKVRVVSTVVYYLVD